MIVLADTSVWIEHLRTGHTTLTPLLTEGRVIMHPFIVGELSCGNLKHRTVILESLSALPMAKLATHAEGLHLVETHCLWGKGLGWIDVQLLASALISQCALWTLDTRLRKVAAELSVAAVL